MAKNRLLIYGTTLGDIGSRRQLSFSYIFKTTSTGKEEKNTCIPAELCRSRADSHPLPHEAQVAYSVVRLKNADGFQVHRRLDHSYIRVSSGK